MLSNANHLLKQGPVVVAYSIARAGARFSKGSGIVAKFLAHKPVNFASLSYSFIACIIFKIIIKTDFYCKRDKHKTAFRARKVSGLLRNGPLGQYFWPSYCFK